VVDDKKHKVIRALAMIVVNDFQALAVLGVKGFGLQAAKIARTTFETAVNIRYLVKFPDEVENFVDFQHFSNKIFFDRLTEFFPAAAKSLNAEDVDETEEQLMLCVCVSNRRSRRQTTLLAPTR
jgi:hypothetical protein